METVLSLHNHALFYLSHVVLTEACAHAERSVWCVPAVS